MFKGAVPKNLASFTGKQFCQSLILIELQTSLVAVSDRNVFLSD